MGLMSRAKIMVLVSHDMGSVQELCNRAIWLNHGQVIADGSPQQVVDEYRAYALAKAQM